MIIIAIVRYLINTLLTQRLLLYFILIPFQNSNHEIGNENNQ